VAAPSRPAAPPERRPPQELAAALKSAAARAAELAGQGLALLFAHVPGPGTPPPLPPLRAAAGFDTPAAALAAANALGAAVCEAVEADEERTLPAPPALGPLAAGGAWIAPLGFEGRVHGALLVGSRAALDPVVRQQLQLLARSVAIRLDHAALAERVRELEAKLVTRDAPEEDRSDEILKLSEALFAQDIELLRNNEKLGKIEKLKNDFIEKMSRELRTPLNGIIEAVITVLAGENERLSDASKAVLRQALDDGTSFLRTLQNILDLWRIKQGELPVEAQEVNFREVVEEAIFSVQDALEGKDVEIHREIREPLPKLRTDLAKVNQIVFLLLDNAVKFTPRGRIDILAGVESGHLVCEVRDTGIGICPDDQQFIFDEFYQVDDLASTKYRGSGLGLALVRDLLILLDGEIELASEVGQGSSFTFRIPVEVIAGSAPPRA
jgi:signal transduction histidine kinase